MTQVAATGTTRSSAPAWTPRPSSWAARRNREPGSRVSGLVLQRREPKTTSRRIDNDRRAGMRRPIDALRLAIAMIPAANEPEPSAKIAGLAEPNRVVAANASFEAMIVAALRAAISALKSTPMPTSPSRWLSA
jgi:hypothetical protein